MQKASFILLGTIYLLMFVSCGESVPDKTEWADEAKTIKIWERKTENGTTKITYYYANGNIKRVDEYKGLKKDGNSTQYYENGKLEFEKQYTAGLKTGIHKRYYNNGQLSSESHYNAGDREKTWTYYLCNGEKWLIESYTDNALASAERLLTSL